MSQLRTTVTGDFLGVEVATRSKTPRMIGSFVPEGGRSSVDFFGDPAVLAPLETVGRGESVTLVLDVSAQAWEDPDTGRRGSARLSVRVVAIAALPAAAKPVKSA